MKRIEFGELVIGEIPSLEISKDPPLPSIFKKEDKDSK